MEFSTPFQNRANFRNGDSGGETSLTFLSSACGVAGLEIKFVSSILMPGMDGLELARMAGEIAPCMPVIMSTGDISQEICSLAKEAGIIKLYGKPFRFEEILVIVKKIMAEKKNQES